MRSRQPRDHTRGTGGHRYNPTSKRLRDLERVIRHRHGTVPATDDADVYLIPVAHALLRLRRDKGDSSVGEAILVDLLGTWALRWAPRVPLETLQGVARDAVAKPYMAKADALGRRLLLSYDDRQALKITSIGSYDVDQAARAARAKERRRARDRTRKEAARRSEGRVPRKRWLADRLTTTRPWERLGICRRTYERRLKRGIDVASVSAPPNVASVSPHRINVAGAAPPNSSSGPGCTSDTTGASCQMPARRAGNRRAEPPQNEPRAHAVEGNERLASALPHSAVASEPHQAAPSRSEKKSRPRKRPADGRPTPPPNVRWVGGMLHEDLRVANVHTTRSLGTRDIVIAGQLVAVRREIRVADAYYGGIGKPGPRPVNEKRNGPAPKSCYWLRGSLWTSKRIRGRCHQRSLRTADPVIAEARRDYVHELLLDKYGPAGRPGPSKKRALSKRAGFQSRARDIPDGD